MSGRGAFALVALLVVGCGGANSASDGGGGGGGGGGNVTDLGPGDDMIGGSTDDMASTVPDVVHQIAGVTVATLAGSSAPGATDGTGAAAQFTNPVGLALDASGLLYLTEYDVDRVRTVDANGVTHTIAVNAGASTFACPYAIAIAGPGTLVVQTDCDTTGSKGDTSGTLWQIDVASGAASVAVQGLGRPRGLAYASATTLVVSDRIVHTLSTLASPATTMTTLAGSAGQAGYADGTGGAALFSGPYGMAKLPDGRVLVADSDNHRLRAATMAGAVTTFAGGSDVGSVDGVASAARFNWPTALAVDAAGEVFVSDRGSHRIRRVATDGSIMTVAGDGKLGFADGAGGSAEFYGQEGLAVTADGKTLYVADGNGGDFSDHHRVRVIRIP